MSELLDRVSWPARRWLCDRLVGRHAYSRHVSPPASFTFSTSPPTLIFDFTQQQRTKRRRKAS